MNLYYPFINMSTKFSFLSKLFQTKRHQLLNQQNSEQEPFNLQLFSILTCSSMFQILFRILFDYHFNESEKKKRAYLSFLK
jgi:hypothetical protein